jgi:hypothetical protein
LTTDYFDSKHPLPSVCAFSFTNFIRPLFHCCCLLRVLQLIFVQGHQFLASRPPLPEEGSIQADPISAASEAPEVEESQDRDDAEDSLEGTSSTTSPPPAHSEEPSLDRKRKRIEEYISLSTSASKASFLSTLCKVLAFRSLCSDNEKPKGDAAAAAIIDIPTSNEPPSQEAGAVVKSPVAPVKNG